MASAKDSGQIKDPVLYEKESDSERITKKKVPTG